MRGLFDSTLDCGPGRPGAKVIGRRCVPLIDPHGLEVMAHISGLARMIVRAPCMSFHMPSN